MRKYLLFVVLLVLNVSAFGATRTWQGRGSGGTGTDFNALANWSGTGSLVGEDLVMTFTVRQNSNITMSASLNANSLIITSSISVNNSGYTTTINTGAFNLTLAGAHAITNGSVATTGGGGATTRPHSIIINIASGGTLVVGGNLNLLNTDVSFSTNSISYNNSGSMTVTGSTLCRSLNSLTPSYVGFFVGNNPALFTFNGAVTLDDNTSDIDNSILLGSSAAGTTGSYTFRNNLTLGQVCAANGFLTAATFNFDGTSTQNITFGNVYYFCNFPNVVIGNTNNPTINLLSASSILPDNILLNLTINGSSIFNLNALQWNRNSNGGTFLLRNTSRLRLAGTTSALLGGSATLFTSSNFPSGFTTFTADSTSTVEYYANTNQTIAAPSSAPTYGNLIINGSTGTKSLGGNINVTRALTVNASNTLALGNNDIALISNNQTTAYMTNVLGSITYGTGRFEVQRYLPSQVAWRLLAAPIQSTGSPTVFQAYQENTTATTSTGFGTQITGIGAGNGFDLQTPSYSMKYFNSTTQNFTPITNTSTAIANPAGYYIFVRGDKSIAPGGGGFTTLRMKGQVFTGAQVVNVPVGFASFGNPYPSRIDFRTVGKTTTVNGFIVWNPGAPGMFNVGGYEAYTLQGGNYMNSGGTITRNFIESGEAVYVQSTTAGTVTINETDKANGSSIVSRESNRQGNDARFVLALSRLDATNVPTYKSAILINPDAAYSNDLDNNDVRKFNNSSDNLSMTVAAANLEVNRRDVFTAKDTIYLKLTSTAVANYMFDAFAENIDAPGLTAYLQDKFSNTTTILSLSDSTHIPFSISATAGSNAADRFSIVFKQAEVLPISFTSITAVRNADKTATVNWAVATETGVVKYDIEHSTDGTTFIKIGEQNANNAGLNATYSFLHSGASTTENFYRIRSKENAGNSNLSNVAKIAAVNELNNVLLSVFPNPVSNGIMNVTLGAPVAVGKYQITLYDNAGKQVLQKSGLVATRNSIDVAGLSAGIYTLVATDGKEKYSVKVSIN